MVPHTHILPLLLLIYNQVFFGGGAVLGCPKSSMHQENSQKMFSKKEGIEPTTLSSNVFFLLLNQSPFVSY